MPTYTQATHLPLPMLLPWIDLTPYRGQSLFDRTIPSDAGVYLSMLHAANFGAGDDIASVQCDVEYGLGGLVITSHRATDTSYPYIISQGVYDPNTITFGSDRVVASDILYDVISKSRDPIPLDAPPVQEISCTLRKYTAANTYTNVTYEFDAPGWATFPLHELCPVSFLEQTGAAYGGSVFYTWFTQNLPLMGDGADYLTKHELAALPVYLCAKDKGREYCCGLIGYQPSRPLASPPTLIERCTAVDHVTIGGRNYHMQHSRHKTWQVELLLDGASDHGLISDFGPDGMLDPVHSWDTFLKWAEVGVTLWIDRALGPGPFTRPRCYPYFPGMPNRITGMLLDASQLRLVYDDGIARRYKVTLTIAEEVPF